MSWRQAMGPFFNQTCSLNDPDWMALISSRPEANIFHHPAWSKVIEATYGYRPFACVVSETKQGIQAGIPVIEVKHAFSRSRWISLPFTDHCSPLADEPASLNQLTRSMENLQRKGDVSKVEVRSKLPELPGIQFISPFVNHELLLNSDLSKVSEKLHKMHLRNISRAEENGIQVVFGNEIEQLKAFYQLHLVTRKRQGVPIQPWRFFKHLNEVLFNTGLGFVVLAYLDSQCISGAVFLHWNQTLTYKFGATTITGNKLRANNLVMWKAICWGCENGFTTFDLGRTDLDNDGLRQYKSRWGAAETPLTYSIMSDIPVTTPKSRVMPLIQGFITKSPAWVCQATGELFYKYSV